MRNAVTKSCNEERWGQSRKLTRQLSGTAVGRPEQRGKLVVPGGSRARGPATRSGSLCPDGSGWRFLSATPSRCKAEGTLTSSEGSLGRTYPSCQKTTGGASNYRSVLPAVLSAGPTPIRAQPEFQRRAWAESLLNPRGA